MMNLIFRVCSFLNNILLATDPTENSAVDPMYEFLDVFGPVLMTLLMAAGTIYSIVLGVQYSKAEDGKERDVAKKKMVNAIVGFLVIIVLVILLYALRGPIVAWLNS